MYVSKGVQTSTPHKNSPENEHISRISLKKSWLEDEDFILKWCLLRGCLIFFWGRVYSMRSVNPHGNRRLSTLAPAWKRHNQNIKGLKTRGEQVDEFNFDIYDVTIRMNANNLTTTIHTLILFGPLLLTIREGLYATWKPHLCLRNVGLFNLWPLWNGRSLGRNGPGLFSASTGWTGRCSSCRCHRGWHRRH